MGKSEREKEKKQNSENVGAVLEVSMICLARSSSLSVWVNGRYHSLGYHGPVGVAQREREKQILVLGCIRVPGGINKIKELPICWPPVPSTNIRQTQ